MTKVDPLLHFALLVWLFEFIAFVEYVNLVGYYRLHLCDLVLPPISVLRLLSWFDQDVLCIHSRQGMAHILPSQSAIPVLLTCLLT